MGARTRLHVELNIMDIIGVPGSGTRRSMSWRALADARAKGASGGTRRGCKRKGLGTIEGVAEESPADPEIPIAGEVAARRERAAGDVALGRHSVAAKMRAQAEAIALQRFILGPQQT